eukprot:TRINITY_DN9910_c0_g1_i1.p1 TRINITY_DN9910_c0_g1~~TRINITY_DN9910_c0_g1_i1.p1  ORF type:complete len:247 (-),score=27.52 TRINITY_DN9910_c0_g1_i1:118-858(-)
MQQQQQQLAVSLLSRMMPRVRDLSRDRKLMASTYYEGEIVKTDGQVHASLIGPQNEADPILITLTNYRMIIKSMTSADTMWIPFTTIDTLKKEADDIIMTCKDVRVLKIKVHFTNQLGNGSEWLYSYVRQFVEVDHLVDLFAFHYRFYKDVSQSYEDGWTLYNVFEHYKRYVSTGAWCFTDANKDYKLCATYPQDIIVPTSVNDKKNFGSSWKISFQRKNTVLGLETLYEVHVHLKMFSTIGRIRW